MDSAIGARLKRNPKLQRFTEFVLANHSLYRTFRRLTGSDRVNREFVERYVRPQSGETILDLGCGPGDVCELMSAVKYIGVDFSEGYIAAARKRFGNRATFLCGDLNDVARERFGTLDTVIAMGVIHHLSDPEVIGVLQTVRTLLRPGGRFISYDPCFTEAQHPIARWIHRHDRGQFVRFDKQYEDLICQVFVSYKRHIRTDLCTVPATVVIFECESPRSTA
jgi:2-polyprenyl-3-methyl-5-hydroxy-6-metoxy-1,4-benzoquinol methylase